MVVASVLVGGVGEGEVGLSPSTNANSPSLQSKTHRPHKTKKKPGAYIKSVKLQIFGFALVFRPGVCFHGNPFCGPATFVSPTAADSCRGWVGGAC